MTEHDTQPTDNSETPTLIRIDGDEFMTNLIALIESVGSLVTTVAALEARIERLERKAHKGFKP